MTAVSTTARRKPGIAAFAALYGLDSTARALSLNVMPVQAHEIFGDDARVSAVYFAVTVVGFLGAFAIPGLMHRFGRRWVYSAGLLAGGLALVALVPADAPGQVAGQMLRALAGSASTISLMLYVLDTIPRWDMARYEPMRLFAGALPWGLGPWVGIELYKHFGVAAAALAALAAALAALLLFRRLDLRDNPVLTSRKPPSPLASIRRFVRQPRLRLAWLIAFGRSGWWSMIFVYPALYFQARQIDPALGGLFVGAANLLLILGPLYGWAGRRFGIRRPIMLGFFGTGAGTLLAVLLFDRPPAFAASLLAAAGFAVILDGLGNVPFLRAVRPLERPQMTSVFRTYIDLGAALPFAVFTALLTLFDQRAVYLAYGLFLFAVGAAASYLPRRM